MVLSQAASHDTPCLPFNQSLLRFDAKRAATISESALCASRSRYNSLNTADGQKLFLVRYCPNGVDTGNAIGGCFITQHSTNYFVVGPDSIQPSTKERQWPVFLMEYKSSDIDALVHESLMFVKHSLKGSGFITVAANECVSHR